jgi:hypothetical protein
MQHTIGRLPEFEAAYYRKLLEKAWVEVAFVLLRELRNWFLLQREIIYS